MYELQGPTFRMSLLGDKLSQDVLILYFERNSIELQQNISSDLKPLFQKRHINTLGALHYQTKKEVSKAPSL